MVKALLCGALLCCSIFSVAQAATTVSCDVLVVGGGTGGVAAAHEAASRGVKTCLVAESFWLGGQMTSQGTSALDEAYLDFAEPYDRLVQLIRQYYIEKYNVPPASQFNSFDGRFDPGLCWVSRFCFEPSVAARIIEESMLNLTALPTLQIFRGYLPESAIMSASTVTGINFVSESDTSKISLTVMAAQTVDATELGDLYPLTNTSFRVGIDAQNDTGEPHALPQAYPDCVQPVTFPFVLENRPDSENWTISQPPDYDPSLYSMNGYKVFQSTENYFDQAWKLPFSFWTYRRVAANSALRRPSGTDLAMINWSHGNDFNVNCGADGCNIIGRPRDVQQRIQQRAKNFALGFVYWLQTTVPRDDNSNSFGYRNLKLVMDGMGSSDGMSQYPYIRESRRLRPLKTVVEQEAASTQQKNQRFIVFRSAATYGDAVGLARYVYFDIHQMAAPCPGNPGVLSPGSSQIPLQAMIPLQTDGLIAGTGKNLGTTHITNGIFRLHPVEWSVGLAAGAVAAFSVQNSVSPRQIATNDLLLRKFQFSLLQNDRAGPLYWWGDRHNEKLSPESQVIRQCSDKALYQATQMLGVMGVILGGPGLAFYPDEHLAPADASAWISALVSYQTSQGAATRPTPTNETKLQGEITRGDFIASLVKTFCARNQSPTCIKKPDINTFGDICMSSGYFPFVETAAARGWLANDVKSNGDFDKNADCYSSTGRFFWPSVSIRRGEAAKILWSVAFNEVYRGFQ